MADYTAPALRASLISASRVQTPDAPVCAGFLPKLAGPSAGCYRGRLPMLTSAITAVITGVLSFFGIPPGPYIAGVWIGVKIVLVSIIALVAWRTASKARRAAAQPKV